MKFVSKISTVGSFHHNYDQETISNEPMFYRASMEFARNFVGIITKDFLSNLPEDWKTSEVTIDSRVHMLIPGWYPCIPGMHHDDIPRTRIDGQPDYEAPNLNTMHLMGLVNASIAPTQFALGSIDLDIPPIGNLIYRDWHPIVMGAIDTGRLSSVHAQSGIMYEFDNHTFHQGTASVKSGWRWFIRLSKNTDRAKNCKNEIRKQTQVYMENPMEGW